MLKDSGSTFRETKDKLTIKKDALFPTGQDSWGKSYVTLVVLECAIYDSDVTIEGKTPTYKQLPENEYKAMYHWVSNFIDRNIDDIASLFHADNRYGAMQLGRDIYFGTPGAGWPVGRVSPDVVNRLRDETDIMGNLDIVVEGKEIHLTGMPALV